MCIVSMHCYDCAITEAQNDWAITEAQNNHIPYTNSKQDYSDKDTQAC